MIHLFGCLVFKFFEADTKILDCFAQSIGKGGCLINSIRIRDGSAGCLIKLGLVDCSVKAYNVCARIGLLREKPTVILCTLVVFLMWPMKTAKLVESYGYDALLLPHFSSIQRSRK